MLAVVIVPVVACDGILVIRCICCVSCWIACCMLWSVCAVAEEAECTECRVACVWDARSSIKAAAVGCCV